ncbi:nuclear transport factor 2, partial [Lasiosphaeria hispida]
QFITHYYNTFDCDRKALAGLYEAPTAGVAAIAEKLVSLPFQKVVHKFVSPDVQPTAAGGALVSVLGQLLVDDSDAPLSYAQTFLLAKDAAGSWYVQNDIFKLV